MRVGPLRDTLLNNLTSVLISAENGKLVKYKRVHMPICLVLVHQMHRLLDHVVTSHVHAHFKCFVSFFQRV